MEYINRLLPAFALPEPERPSQPQTLPEPLKASEIEVLRLLTTHLSVPEIAQELFITPSTVRSHIKNIYTKLDVHSRKEAVQRAKELTHFYDYSLST